MATRLTVDETKIAFDGIRKQIKQLEVSIMAVYHSGRAPLGSHEEIEKMRNEAIEHLEQARGRMEALICWFDS